MAQEQGQQQPGHGAWVTGLFARDLGISQRKPSHAGNKTQTGTYDSQVRHRRVKATGGRSQRSPGGAAGAAAVCWRWWSRGVTEYTICVFLISVIPFRFAQKGL